MTDTIRACCFLDKGGVGKTTATAHLGVALADLGYDVLLVDLAGKQNDLAKHFGVFNEIVEMVENENDWPNISTAFDESWNRIHDQLGNEAVDRMLLETNEGPDLIPAHEGLDSVDDALTSIPVPERYQVYDEFLTTCIEPRGYDIILTDLPGNTGNVSLNGIFACENVIVPAEPGAFEDGQIQALFSDTENYNEKLDTDLTVSMVMPNKVDTRTNVGEAFLKDFADDYPETVAPTHVPKSTGIKNAQMDGTTIFAQDEDERLKTADRAADAYLENARELITRLESGAA